MKRTAFTCAVLAAVFCSCAYAQNKQAAVKALGKFAAEVATKLAVDISKDEIRQWIRSAAPGSATSATQAQSSQGNPPSATPVTATPAWIPPQRVQQQSHQFSLAWTDPRDQRQGYVGYLQMWGAVGYFNVVTVFAGTPISPIVQQVMVASLAPNGTDVILTGYYPRIAGTNSAAPNYSSDAFRLTQTAFGGWTIADTCSVGGCAPVFVVDSNRNMQ